MSDHPNSRPPPRLGNVRPATGQGTPRPPDRPSRGPQAIYARGKPIRAGLGVGSIVLYGLLGLLSLIVAGGTFLVLSPPTELIRDRIAEEVRSHIGRDLKIGGDAHFTVWPALGVTLTDVTLSAPLAMPGAPLLTTQGLDVRLALMPLLTREIRIERLILQRPMIDLRVDGQGRRNWDFAATEALRAPGTTRLAQLSPQTGTAGRAADRKAVPAELQDFARNATQPQSAQARTLAGLDGLSLSDVRVVDGTVTYSDARTGIRHAARSIDLRISLPDAGGPLDLAGQLDFAGERITVNGRVASLRDAIAERPTRATLRLVSRPLEASYDGSVVPGPAIGLDGRLSIKSPSVAALARFLTVPVQGLETLGALALEGQIKAAGPSIALSGTNFALGQTAAVGSLSVGTSSPRPLIKADLKFATLDLGRFTDLEAGPAMAAPPAAPPFAGRFSPGAPQPPAGAAPGSARSIEDLLRRSDAEIPAAQPGAAVRGFAKRTGEGWSQDALDSAALRMFDLDGRFEIGRLFWRQTKINQSLASVVLKDGVLKATVTDAELYGGRAKALINVDASQPMLTLGVNISADGVAAQAMLKDAAGIDWLDGRSRANIALSARGGSERELVGSLTGRADLQVADGAVAGWDFSQMTGGLSQGRIPSLDRSAGARTPFSELAGSFQIANGVARTQDLRLESPALRAAGSGVINLVDRNIDLVVKPKASGAGGLAGIEVPVRIAGPWDKISAIPDIGGVLKSPQAIEAAKQLGRQLQDGNVDGALRGVLGNDPKADEKVGKAKELLRQFLNR